MIPKVIKGSVKRKFHIDYPTGVSTTDFLEEHNDDIMDALGSIKNATEMGSGHVGFYVEIEDDKRSDDKIIAEIQRKLKPFYKTH